MKLGLIPFIQVMQCQIRLTESQTSLRRERFLRPLSHLQVQFHTFCIFLLSIFLVSFPLFRSRSARSGFCRVGPRREICLRHFPIVWVCLSFAYSCSFTLFGIFLRLPCHVSVTGDLESEPQGGGFVARSWERGLSPFCD
jgi:hypothetical protein